MTHIDTLVMNSVEGRGITWQLAERVVKDSIVDQYLETFANDANYDNAVMLVKKIMEIERNRSYGDD